MSRKLRPKRPCEICGKTTVRKRFCSNECKFKFQGQTPVTKEWLERKYSVEGLDCPGIARIVKRDNKTVWAWLKKMGIPTRGRGCGNGSRATQLKQGNCLFKGHKHTPEAKEIMRQKRIAAGNVPYLKDGKPWMKGRFGPLSTNWKGGHTPDRVKVQNSDAWKAAVKTVWKRDDGLCQRCGLAAKDVNQKKRMNRFHMHHLVSFSENKELRCDPNNLVLLCNPCHHWVHSRENTEFEFLDQRRWMPKRKNRDPDKRQLSLFDLMDKVESQATRNLRSVETEKTQYNLFDAIGETA